MLIHLIHIQGERERRKKREKEKRGISETKYWPKATPSKDGPLTLSGEDVRKQVKEER